LANVIFKASFERNLTLEYPGAGASTQKKKIIQTSSDNKFLKILENQ
jgi:hypothetical protein